MVSIYALNLWACPEKSRLPDFILALKDKVFV